MGTLVDYDGNVYDTIVIGNQEWIVQNFKCTSLNDGTAIPEVTGGPAWGALTTPGRCAYNNDNANRAVYGELYNWYTVGTGNLAPEGWRVSTSADWTVLSDFLGGDIVAGGKLKETGTTHWELPNEGATNESGFSALPGGYRGIDGNFRHQRYEGYWWSSTEDGAWSAYYLYLYWYMSYLGRDNHDKMYGYSVRLVRDVKIITINQSQFNWVPPSDYPFTKNNVLYDKDIDYIRANKKKLKPFSGITAPPNPGYNFSAYPGYETGLFGYSRKDYRTSGRGS